MSHFSFFSDISAPFFLDIPSILKQSNFISHVEAKFLYALFLIFYLQL